MHSQMLGDLVQPISILAIRLRYPCFFILPPGLARSLNCVAALGRARV